MDWNLTELIEALFPGVVLLLIGSALVAGNMIAGRRQSQQGNGSLLRLFLVSLVFVFVEIAPVIVMAVIANVFGDARLISETVILAWIAMLISLYHLIGNLRPHVIVPNVDQAIPLVKDPDLLARCADISQKMGMNTPTMRMYYALNPGTTRYAWAEGLSAPLVVVTDDLVLNFDRDECDAVIAHELAHIANGSLWVLVMSLPFSLFVATVISVFVPLEVAFSLAFAIWTGLFRTTSRLFETDCDRRAGDSVGYNQKASAVTRFPSSRTAKNLDWLGQVTTAIGTHPHRDVRINSLLSHLSPAELAEAEIPFSLETVRQQTRMATIAFMIWLATIGVCLAAAWRTTSAPWVCLPLLIVALGPFVLDRWQNWRNSKSLRRQMRNPMALSYGNLLITGALVLTAASLVAVYFDRSVFGIPAYFYCIFSLVIFSIAREQRTKTNELLAQVRHAIQLKEFERVIELSKQYPKVVARSPHLRHNLALATSIVRTRSEAIEILETARKDFPKFKLSWFLLFNLYMDEGDAAKALEVARGIAAGLSNDAGAFLAIARAEQRLGHLDQSESAAQRATELEPDSCHIKAMMAAISLDRGDAGRATELIEQAAQSDPKANYVQLIKAQIWLRSRPIDEARKVAEHAIVTICENPRHCFHYEIELLKQELATKSAVEV